MGNKMKRFLSMLLAVVMVIGMMPTNIVFAEDGENADATVIEASNEVAVATLEDLKAALAADNNLPIVVTAEIQIPAGETVVLDLNGKTVTVPDSDGKHIYALNNKGVLTIKDTKGNGSITARGIYNGYNGSSTDGTVEGAKMIIESGKFVGMDTDGGAAIFNCAELVINGGDFTGGVAAINNRTKGVATINGGTYHGGNNYVIQNNGGTLIINNATVDSGFGAVGCFGGTTTIVGGTFLPTGSAGKTCHVVYVAGAANVTINGGTFKMNYPSNAVPDSGSAVASYYNGTLTINGGTFTSHFDKVSPVELSEGSTIKGGTYMVHSGTPSNHTYVTKYLAEGVELGEDGTVKPAAPAVNYVAQIGTIGYETLAAAVEAAQDGDIITLLADIEQADGVLINNKNLTIDLNGKTYTVTEGASTNNRNIKINGTSKVTIKNGTMVAAGSNSGGTYGTVRTEDTAKVTLDNVKLYNYRGGGLNVKACSGTTVTISNSEIYAQYGGGVEAAAGNVELNNTKIVQKGVFDTGWYSVALEINGGGTITVNSGDYYGSAIETDANAAMGNCVAFILSSGGTLTINGGTFTGVVSETAAAGNFCGLIYADKAAVVNINGGTFNSNGAILDMRNNAGSQPNPAATLAGGTFSADPRVSGLYSSNLITVADGFGVVENTDGTYGVQKVATYVAEVNGVGYATLADAFAAAQDGDEIVLLADATPALTSQRAITKAAVIDLGGKTLTLTEDDLYFGTTTFKNGTIVVDPSVTPSTAVFWMFANQTLTFDNVKVVATGVTGTYLIGLEGTNSNLNLLNGSEILIDNTTALDLDVICVNGSSDNKIVIADSKVNVTNLDGRVLFRGNYTIKGNSELKGITKAGIRIEAGQTLAIEDTAKVAITGEPRDGGIHLTDATATYTKAETATVIATVNAPAPAAVAYIGEQGYETIAAAIAAAKDGDTVVIMPGEYGAINISNKNITIAGTVGDNGELLTTIKGGDPAITGHGFNGTIKNLKIVDAWKVMYAEPAGNVTVDNVYVTGATYGLHLVAYSTGLTWTIQNSYMDLSWANSFGVSGEGDAAIIITGNTFASNNPYYPDYGALPVNTYLPNVTVEENIFDEGTKIYIDKSVSDTSKINISKNYHADGVENAFAEDTGVTVSVYPCYADEDKTQLVNAPVAQVGDAKFESLADAFAAAQDGDTITLLADIAMSEGITNTKKVTLDLNGKTITGTDNATGSFGLFTNKGGLTVTGNGTITLKATNNRGWNAYSSIFSNTVGGKLIVENGTFEHLGGTDMAYAIDNLTNGKGTYAETVINGGTIKSTYRAIRQFLNGVEAQNILTVNGGTIEGANKSIWMQDPSKNANTGTLTVAATANLVGDVYLSVTEGSTEWPVTVSIAGAALPEGYKVATNDNVPAGYVVENVNGTWGVSTGLKGSGTEADPYLIATVDDLIKFRDSVNKGETKYNEAGKYVALDADIDLAGIDWSVNIGDDCNATFDGIFDGKGHTIKNLTSTETAQKGDGYVCTGLFGAIYGSAVIKNLTIENATINTGDFTGNNAGIVVGFVYKGNDAVIENVKVTGNIQLNAKGIYGVGAIVGYAYYGNSLTIKDCVVDGNDGSKITAFSGVSGIIGYSSNDGLKVEDCTVQNVALNAKAISGGIAGVVTCGTFDGNTVENVAITLSGENWQNSAAVVVGTLSGTSVTVSNTTYSNVNATAIVGSQYAEKPTTPVAKIEAKIDNTYYYDFAGAYKAATANQTITLLVPVVVNAGETLELNKDVTIMYTSDVPEAMITNNGTMIVNGATIVYAYTGSADMGKAANAIVNSGNLTINSGAIQNTATANQIGYAIDNNSTTGNAILTIAGGEISVSGSGYYDGIRLFANSTTNENSVTVTGGTVSSIWMQNPSDGESEKNTKNVKASVTISGGEVGALYLEPSSAFEASISGGKIGSVAYHQTAEGRDLTGFITGGTFNTEVPAAYVADGYEVEKNADGTYSIKAVTGYTVSGTITSGGSETDLITIELFAGDASIATTVTGNTASYSISGVPSGKYTMKVTKNAHMDYSTEITVDGNAVVDVTLELGVGSTKFRIAGANLTLSDNINVNFWAEIPEGFTDVYMVFTMHGEETIVSKHSGIDESDGQYKYIFSGVKPHTMGDNISATIYGTYKGTKVSNTVAEYSVRKYCENQFKKKNLPEKTRILLSDMLVYGAKAQIYASYKANQLVTTGLEDSLMASSFPGLDESYNVHDLTGESSSAADWKSASLNLSNEVRVDLNVVTENPDAYTYEITINGQTTVYTAEDLKETETPGRYSLIVRGIKATGFGLPITAKIMQGEDQVGRTLTYSVYTYVQKYQNSEKLKLAELLQAIYNYGESAKAYNKG